MIKNIQVRTGFSPSVHDLGATITEDGGIKIATLPADHTIVWSEKTDHDEENTMIVLPQTPYSDLPFANPSWIPSAEEIQDFAVGGNRGVICDADGRAYGVSADLGPKLLLAKVRFLICPALTELPEMNQTHLFSEREDGRIVVPFLGEIHYGGETLSEKQLNQCGLEWLKGSDGNDAEFLALLMGNRSIFIPTKLGVGLETKEEIPLGWQYKGTGVRNYAFHAIPKSDSLKLYGPDDVVLVSDDSNLLPYGVPSQRPSYAGRAGVFTDLPHQPDSEVPIGGQEDCLSGIKTQAKLAQDGATQAREFVQVAELLTRERLTNAVGNTDRMTLDSLFVSCEVWNAGGSTIRLDAITHPFRVQSQGFETAARIASQAFGELIAIVYGENSEENRRTKMMQLAEACGRNVATALKAKRSLYVDRNSIDNLTWTGLPLDFGDYHVASGWHQMGALVFRYLYDLLLLTHAAGWDTPGFVEQGFAKMFLSQFLAEDDATSVEKATQGILGNLRPEESQNFAMAANKFSSATLVPWVLPQLRLKKTTGKRFITPNNLLKHCAGSKAVKEKLARFLFSGVPGKGGKFLNGLEFGQKVIQGLGKGPVQIISLGENLGQKNKLEVAYLLLPYYIEATLEANMLLKGKPKQWKKSPPVSEKA